MGTVRLAARGASFSLLTSGRGLCTLLLALVRWQQPGSPGLALKLPTLAVCKSCLCSWLQNPS